MKHVMDLCSGRKLQTVCHLSDSLLYLVRSIKPWTEFEILPSSEGRLPIRLELQKYPISNLDPQLLTVTQGPSI
ncbi:hypothetical protein CIPAW_03G176900 [Carya illinoinensis]|uniref:Uncharacterized protein n=1 Tax=Carya illinoinensis TaxID=32201 RepID=A0A8T1R3Y0_CARIL|nr:hypothetical protein CIPAW_03G176900 [Carya illinoinensis]